MADTIKTLDEKLEASFHDLRKTGLLDEEIVQAVLKESMDGNLYLEGEGTGLWTGEEQFLEVIRERANALMLTLMSPGEMVAIAKRYVDMPDGEVMMGLLFSVGARLRGFLPGELCCYIHFRGRSGTGKSHAGQFFTDISRGDWHEAISEGALLAGVQSGKVMGLDEVDNDIRRVESAEGILRTGHTWNARYTRRVTNEKGNWETESIVVGGPKILTSIGQLDDALESRCYVIDMAESQRKQELSLAWMYRMDDTERIAKSLDGYADLIRARHTPDDISSWNHSPEYLPRLSKLKSCGARRTDLAHIFVTVDWLLGWDAPGLIEALARDSGDEEMDWLRATLLDVIAQERNNGIDIEETGIKATRLLELVNGKRKDSKQNAWSATAFGKRMTELGFSDQGFKYRSGTGCLYRFPEPAMKLLASSTIIQATLPVDGMGDLEKGIERARSMHSEGKSIEEIREAVGIEVVEHCREKGIIPALDRASERTDGGTIQ